VRHSVAAALVVCPACGTETTMSVAIQTVEVRAEWLVAHFAEAAVKHTCPDRKPYRS
jgi:hypothetical protein